MLAEKLSSSTEDLFTSKLLGGIRSLLVGDLKQLKSPTIKLLTLPRSLEVNKSSVEEESFSVSIDIIQC